MKHGGPEFTSVHVWLLGPERAHGSNNHCVCDSWGRKESDTTERLI